MGTPGTNNLTSVEDILMDMIERRAALTPIIEDDWDKMVAATPSRKMKRLMQRIYTPLGQLYHGDRQQRLWRMNPGLGEKTHRTHEGRLNGCVFRPSQK